MNESCDDYDDAVAGAAVGVGYDGDSKYVVAVVAVEFVDCDETKPIDCLNNLKASRQ